MLSAIAAHEKTKSTAETHAEDLKIALEELAAWVAESADPDTRGAARDSVVEGDVVVNWNGDLSVTETLGSFVLAFEAGTLARGGYVVMADGTVKNMTLKEFQAAAMLPAAQP